MSGESDSIRVSQENHRRLVSLAGELQKRKGERVTIDDAISHLFGNQKEDKNHES